MQPSPNPRKTQSFRDLGHVDIAALKAAVGAVSEEMWAAENQSKPNKIAALDRTEHIVFRFVRSFADWRTNFDTLSWPRWRELLEPVLTAASAPYGYARAAYPRIMLARMRPGGVILPHQDVQPAAKWPHKVHVPLD